MLVIVQWSDITGSDGPWSDLEEALDLRPAEITTIGRMVVDQSEYIVIASSWGDEGELGNLNCIPRPIIKSIKVIGDPPDEARIQDH